MDRPSTIWIRWDWNRPEVINLGRDSLGTESIVVRLQSVLREQYDRHPMMILTHVAYNTMTATRIAPVLEEYLVCCVLMSVVADAIAVFSSVRLEVTAMASIAIAIG
jgi:hypothetical protein